MNKEEFKLLGALGLAIVAVVVLISTLGYKLGFFKKESSTKIVKEININFTNPDFKVGDCFLVSSKGEKLHPHYLKIVEKDLTKLKYSVLETIGNGKNSEINVYLNYYTELKSFDKYRSSCPTFLIKQ